MSVGKRIKERRLELKMSADELAEKIDRNRATVYRYERGDIENLPLDILEPLAKALNTTPAWIMGWHKEYKPLDNNGITMGDVFKALRITNNLSVEEFSNEIGISVAEIKSYKSGQLPVPVGIINLVADFFGISISDIIEEHKDHGKNGRKKANLKKDRLRRFKEWHETFGDIDFSDEEINKMMEYAKFLISQRGK